jgi:predicted ATP-dependent protease
MARVFRREVWCNDAVPWTREVEAAFAALANGVERRYDLPAFDPGAVARLIEEGARRSGGLNRSRLSTDLMLLHDLAVEAGELARSRGGASVIGGDITEALNRRRALQSSLSRQVREAILTGESMTPTSGSAIGQINGLGIYEWHPYEASFAVPMRISATVSPGRDERVLDIEQEAQQADADHVRGSMTMEGYLTHRYSEQRPLSVIIRIRFEQEHGGTGGDSASAAQLFTLLSALAQQPIRCSLAVTGAVGQYGEIQPIGGVNTKIDGFWEVCRMRYQQGERPEGGYGVIIPSVNARDLMLRPEVAGSIANEGWFHIWPVATVDEAIPLLMGAPAATIHQRVEQRLKRFHEMARSR